MDTYNAGPAGTPPTMVEKLLCVLCLVFFCSIALPSPSAGALPTLPLSKIVQQAVERSQSILAEKQGVLSEEAKIAQAGLWQNPTVAIAAGKISNLDGQGPLLEATVYQTIPFPGKLGAKERSSAVSKRLAESDQRKSTLQVEAEAYALSYQLAALHKLTAHIEERHRSFRMIRGFLATRSAAVPAQRAEKQLIINKLTLLEEHLILKKAQRRQVWLALQELVQEPAEFLPEVPWWKKTILAPLESLIQNPEAAPSLQKQTLLLQKAEAELEVAKNFILPDVNLGVGYRNEQTGSSTHFYTGYLNLSIPVFDRGQYSVGALRSQVEAERLRGEAKRRNVQHQLEAAYTELGRACETTALYPTSSLDRLEKDFAEAENEFKRGRLPISVYLELESQSHELQDRVFESQYELARAVASFSILAGKMIHLEVKTDAE